MQKYQHFNGIKFTRDEKTGYYLNSTIRKRLHRYVWEFYNGKIPEGYQIHHKDKDKSNNDISNLELMPFSAHVLRTAIACESR
jgi:sugar lactone lactonase YvrE